MNKPNITPTAGAVFAGVAIGGLLFYYGRKRKGTWRGRLTSAAGLSLLTRALRNPTITRHLGPLQSYLEGPIAAAQKLLA